MIRHALSLMLIASSAHAAQAEHVALVWRATAGCIDEATLAKTVEQTLGRPVFSSTRPPAAIVEGDVGPGKTGFRATVTLKSPAGDVLAHRELETKASSCDRFDESVAVVVALMVDGVAEPEPPPAPPPAPRIETSATTPLRIADAPPRSRPIRLGAEVDFSLVLGLLPKPSAGASIRAGVQRDFWSADLSGSFWAPTNASDAGVTADVWAFAIALDPCVAPIRRSVRLAVCATFGAGATEASVKGVLAPGRAELPFGFAGGAVDFSVPLGSFLSAHFRASLLGLFISPEYVFHPPDGSTQTLFRAWPIAPVITLGFGARSGS